MGPDNRENLTFGAALGCYFIAAPLVGVSLGPNLPLTLAVTALLAFLLLRLLGVDLEPPSLLLAFLAALCVVDVAAVIYANALNPDGFGYFHKPMQSDPERNLIVVNALLRDGLSPFLPGTAFKYQTTWHYGAAAILEPWGHPASPQALNAFVLFTGFAFYYVLLSLVRAKGWSIATAALVVLAVAHADVLNLLLFGGIEADGGTGGNVVLANFSPKLAAITAPQHLTFCTFMLLLLQARSATNERAEMFFIVVCVIVSPVLSAITLSALYLGFVFADSALVAGLMERGHRLAHSFGVHSWRYQGKNVRSCRHCHASQRLVLGLDGEPCWRDSKAPGIHPSFG